MKKLFKVMAVASIALMMFGCQMNSNDSSSGSKDSGSSSSTTTKTIEEKINSADGSIDLGGAKADKDITVKKSVKISNLDMDGKTLTVNIKNVTLTNVKNVDLVAGSGIGAGDLNIESSEIKSLKVQGGGSNSIHLKNTKTETVIVEKEGVRVELGEGCKVTKVQIKADNVKLESNKDVEVKVEVSSIVKSVNIAGGKVTIEATTGASSAAAPKIVFTGATEVVKADNVQVSATEEVKKEITGTTEVVAKVEVVTVTGTALNADAVKKVYEVGQEFDASNLLLVTEYSNGTKASSAVAAAAVTVTGFDSSKAGTGKVTLKTGDKEVTVEVKIVEEPGVYKLDLTELKFSRETGKDTERAGDPVWNIELGTVINSEKLSEVLDDPKDGLKKLVIKGKFIAAADISKLYAKVYNWDGDNKTDRYASISKTGSVVVAENVKAGVETTYEITFEEVDTYNEYVNLVFYIPTTKANGCKNIIENCGAVTNKAEYIMVEPDPNGIKITLYPRNGEFKENNESGVAVMGVPVYVRNYNDAFINNPTQPVSFIYPYTEKGKTYYFGYNWESVKTTAGGGTPLSTVLNDSQINTLYNSKATVRYDEKENEFYAGIDSSMNDYKDILNTDEVAWAELAPGLIMGGTWSNGSWWGGNSGTFVADGKLDPCTYGEGDNKIGHLEALKNCKIPYVWHAPTTQADWKKYKYQYAGYLTFGFRPKSCPETIIGMDILASDILTYTPSPSTKNLNLEEGFKKGIEGVKSTPATKEEFAAFVAEAYSEAMTAFAGRSNMDPAGRSIVTAPEDPIKNYAEASEAVCNVLTEIQQIVNSLDATTSNFKIDFNKSINIGELSFREWFDVMYDVVDALNKATYYTIYTYDYGDYGYGYNGQSEKQYVGIIRQKLGEIPYGYDGIDLDWDMGSRKYYFSRTVKGDKVDISDMPEDCYPTIDFINNKKVVCYYTITGSYDRIIKDNIIVPENFDRIYSYWNSSEEKDEYYFVRIEKGEEIPNTSNLGANEHITTWYENDTLVYGIESERIGIATSESLKAAVVSMANKFEMTEAEAFDFLDKHVSIKNFYLDAKVNVDFDTAKIEAGDAEALAKTASADVKALVKTGVVDLEGAIKTIMPSVESFPVKALNLDVQTKGNASTTNKAIYEVIKSDAKKDFTKIFDTYDIAAGLYVKTAICTKKGVGGIITISAEEKVSVETLNKLSAIMVSKTKPTEDELMNLSKEIGTLKVTVSDGSKDTLTLSMEDIMEIFESMGSGDEMPEMMM